MNLAYPNLPGTGKTETGGFALHFVQGAALDRIADAVERRGGDGTDLRCRALVEFDQAVCDRPGLWQAFEKKGEVLEKLGRFEEAVRAFRKAWAFVEGDAALRTHLARAEAKARPAGTFLFYRSIYERLDKVFGAKKSTSPATSAA
jgi:hypothetical protein